MRFAKKALWVGVVTAAVMWSGAASALSDADKYVFVPNRASADVAVIDTATDRVVATINVGNVPHQVVISDRLGKLVASNTRDNTISIVDLGTLTTQTTLTLGTEPEHMALSPNGGVLAVGNIGAGTVSLVSLETNRERVRVKGLFEPHNLTFSPDGSHLYVANLGANHVSVIDVAAGRIVNEITVADPKAIAARARHDRAEHQGIINVTATPDGKLGFAAHGEGGIMAVIDLSTQRKIKSIRLGDMPWRAYATADGRYMIVPNNGDRTVSVVSTATLGVVATVPGASDMTGVNISGDTAYVISRGDSKAVVIDLAAMKRVGEISLSGSPETGVTTPDGKKIYVALSGADKVAVIDARLRRVTATIDNVGKGPWGATMVGAFNYCH